MKLLRSILLLIAVFAFLGTLQNCTDDDDPTAKEVTETILQSKNWEASSVTVPVNTATDGADWASFKASFSTSSMTTSGHPTGAEAVWPSGAYTVSENGLQITRGDGVVMTISGLTETGYSVSFSVPEGTEIGGRISALDGDYVFNMK